MAADTYLRNLGAPERFIGVIPRLVGQDFGADTFKYIDFDVSKYQRQMDMPVFMLYGTGDMSMPTIQGPQILRDDLARNRSARFVRALHQPQHRCGIDARERMLATFPDLIMTLDTNGQPVTTAGLKQGDEVFLIRVPAERLILGEGMRCADLLATIEPIVGKPILAHVKLK